MATAWLEAEAEFESWFAGRKTAFGYKFEDARMVMGVHRSKSVTAHGQPADYIITSHGSTFWAEVKSSKEPVSFPLANIKRAQWNGCRRVAAAGGDYFFFIRKEPEGVWYRVPAQFMIDIHEAEVKSVKWEQIKDFRYD